MRHPTFAALPLALLTACNCGQSPPPADVADTEDDTAAPDEPTTDTAEEVGPKLALGELPALHAAVTVIRGEQEYHCTSAVSLTSET